ncbi:MAG: VCBS repeat-containing protein [Pseudomonadota bacterium]
MLSRLALLATLCAGCALADGAGHGPPVAAWLEDPTDIYPHDVLGDVPEHLVLAARDADGTEYRRDLRDVIGPPSVFEDIAPRLVDATGDGRADIVVVESALDAGAQLSVYTLRSGELVKVAATPHIGTPFRWLAPVAVADLDGNGVIDLAYVETPHIAPTLKVWTWGAGGLTEVAQMEGVTNHRIGENFISGGLRDCGMGPQMVLADKDWRYIQIVTLSRDGLLNRDTHPIPANAKGFDEVMSCNTGF